MSVEAGMSLQYDKDNVWGPAYKSQHYTATQEKPVVGVVVNQALQSMGDQRLAQRDLDRGRQGEIKGSDSARGFGIDKMERGLISNECKGTQKETWEESVNLNPNKEHRFAVESIYHS